MSNSIDKHEQPPNKKPKIMSNGSNGVQNGRSANGAEGDANGHFDPNLYSRQLLVNNYTLGHQAMTSLRTASVLIAGMNGTGVEIAKNLILGGVRHVTIQDTQPCTWRDLSAQYYLQESAIGQNRAAASHGSLAELNDTVTVQLCTDELQEPLVTAFDLVVLCASPLAEQLTISGWLRGADKKLIIAETRGLFAQLFNDFGPAHSVNDANGEQPLDGMIEHIDLTTGDVTMLEEAKHGLEDGDFVRFSEVKGMTAINAAAPIKVKVIGPTKFSLDPAALEGMTPYTEGGIFHQVKMPKIFAFKPLEQALKEPDYLITDFGKFERPAQLHALWQASHTFVGQKGRPTRPADAEDAAALLELAKAAGFEGDDDTSKMVAQQFSYQSVGELCPMTSFIGGVAAQEAMKAITGLYTPLQQFMYFDALECLPGEWSEPFFYAKQPADAFKPRNSRYDAQAAVFGWPYVEHLQRQRWFIVGAGAIGCELLKNFAMMGIATDKAGQLTITDMDLIETSNLNRQFLFRRHDIGSNKSETAAKAAVQFNSALRVQALCDRVGGETEGVFDDAFFESLNGVANALDNVEARRYMDRRCVYYLLPLLESGTMGPKCNTQVVYPHLTESYSSSSDPPEKSIPICTLKHFPNAIEHTIQWARDLFEGKFTNPAEQANKYLDNPRAFMEATDRMNSGQQLEVYQDAVKSLIDERPPHAEACVWWARDMFEHEFTNEIAQLLHTFPPDQLTDKGAKFWSGSKRCPTIVKFDVENPTHLEFVFAAAYLRAELYNLKPIGDIEVVRNICTSYQPPVFKPRDGVRIHTSDAEAQNAQQEVGDDMDKQVKSLQIKLAKFKPEKGSRLSPIDFEKDDDTNHHVEFISAASNLRADNYSITRADALKTKQIAGRIIPAIATTTAAVAGLVCLEMYKVIAAGPNKYKIPLDVFKNAFANLALPFFAFSEPIAAPQKPFKISASRDKITLWDSIQIQGPKTLKDVLKLLEDEYNLEVSMLSSGVSLLYSFFLAADKKEARLAMPMETVFETVSQQKVPGHVRALTLEIMAADKTTDEDVEPPYIKYVIKK